MAFAPDPDGGRYIDPETGLSWGSFQIWVEGRNLCSHLEEGERIDSAHWYLLPLLEWFIRHWNPLLHEERLPIRTAGDTGWTSLYATRFPPPGPPEPPAGGAVLEGSRIQDLAEIVPAMLEASAGSALRLHVRVALDGEAPKEVRTALDALLAGVSEDLKTT